MKHIHHARFAVLIPLLLCAALCCEATAQHVTIENQAHMRLVSGTAVRLHGNLQAGGTYSADPASPTIIDGTSDHYFSGAIRPGPVLKHGSGTLYLQSGLATDGIISLDGGNIATDQSLLTLGSTSRLVDEASGRYLVGEAATVRAVGTGGSDFGRLGVALNPGVDNLGNVMLHRLSGPGAAVTIGTATSINRVWSIVSDNPPTGGRSLTFTWVADDDNGKDLSQVQVWKSTDNGVTWIAEGGVQDASSTRLVGVSGQITFGMYTVCAADLQPQPAHPYLFLAEKDVKVKGLTVSEGLMHANEKIILQEGRPSTHTGDLTAVQEIKVEKKLTIDGDLTAPKLDIDPSATILGNKTTATVAPQTISTVTASAGSQNRTVPRNGSLTLAPGSYNDLLIKKRGTLYLSTGEYWLYSLKAMERAIIIVDVTSGPVYINTVAQIELDKRVQTTITPLGDAGSSQLTFRAMDDVIVKENARVLGTILSNKDVIMEKYVRFRGAVSAEEIDIDENGTMLHHTATLTLPRQDAGSHRPVAEASGIVLEQNYPNPFNPRTTIVYGLPEPGQVRITVTDLFGRQIATLEEGLAEAGLHRLHFDGAGLTSGTYLYTIIWKGQSETRRMTLMK